MDSVTIFFNKGYGRVEHLESQNPKSHSNPNPQLARKNRHITIFALSAIITLTVILCVLIGFPIRESSSESESIRTVCSVTQHKELCISSLSSMNEAAKDPELIFLLSLRVSMNGVSNLSSQVEVWSSRVNDSRSGSGLKDCSDLFEDAAGRLNDSVLAMAEKLTEKKMSDINTWISAAMTDEDTCVDGLEEMGSTVTDEVKAAVHKSEEYMSNSLAILANMHTLPHKLNRTRIY